MKQLAKLCVEHGFVCFIIFQTYCGQTKFGHLPQLNAVLQQIFTCPMRINDHRIPAHWLGQNRNTFDGTTVGSFEREPFPHKRITFPGPSQRAQEKQNNQSSPDEVLSGGHGR